MSVDNFKNAVEKLEQQSIDAAEVLSHPADIDHEKDTEANGNRGRHYYYLREKDRKGTPSLTY
jgi:hypothetical protein